MNLFCFAKHWVITSNAGEIRLMDQASYKHTNKVAWAVTGDTGKVVKSVPVC